MRLVRVDGALLVEEVSGYLCGVAEDEALAKNMEVDNFSYGKVSDEAYNRTELRTILLGPTGYSEPQFTGCEIKNVSYER